MTRETINSRVAVLETKLEAVNNKIDEVRADIKEVHACLHKTRELILDQISQLRTEDNQAHREQNTRITSLENWRWYILGMACAIAVVAKIIF